MLKRKLPDSIKICGIDFNIKYFDRMADVDEDGNKSLIGQCVHSINELRIFRDKKTETAITQLLWHEVLHAVIELEHIEDLSEPNIDRLANALNMISELRCICR